MKLRMSFFAEWNRLPIMSTLRFRYYMVRLDWARTDMQDVDLFRPLGVDAHPPLYRAVLSRNGAPERSDHREMGRILRVGEPPLRSLPNWNTTEGTHAAPCSSFTPWTRSTSRATSSI